MSSGMIRKPTTSKPWSNYLGVPEKKEIYVPKKRPTQKRGHVGNPMPHKLSFNPTHQNSDGNDFGDGLWHWVYRVYHHWWFSKALEDLGRPRACLFLGGLKQQNLSRDKPLGSLWYTQNDWFDETWYNPDEEKQDTFIYIYNYIYIYSVQWLQTHGCHCCMEVSS